MHSRSISDTVKHRGFGYLMADTRELGEIFK